MDYKVKFNTSDLTTSKSPSENFILSNLINTNTVNLATDIKNLDYNKNNLGTVAKLEPITELFIDNIILCCIVPQYLIDNVNNKKKLMLQKHATSYINSTIRDIIKKNGVLLFSQGAVTCKTPVKLKLESNNNSKTRVRIREIFKDGYKCVYMPCAKKEVENTEDNLYFINYKVELSDFNISSILNKLPGIIQDLKKVNIYMSDIDITKDYKYSFRRWEIIKHLQEGGMRKEGEHGDITKGIILKPNAGLNCLTVLHRPDNVTFRSKIYNKYICQLSSGGTNTAFSNHLKNLCVSKHPRLNKSFTEGAEYGLTRLEITIYDSEIYTLEKYNKILDKFLSSLGNKFYITPFKNSYKILEDSIKTCSLLVNTANLTFTFIYWYDSITGKYYSIQQKFKEEHKKNIKPIIKYIISAFSPPKIPINLIKYNIKNGNISIKQNTFIKPNGKITIGSSKKFFVGFSKDTINKANYEGLKGGKWQWELSHKLYNYSKGAIHKIIQIENPFKINMLSTKKLNNKLLDLEQEEKKEQIKANMEKETKEYNEYLNTILEKHEKINNRKKNIDYTIKLFNGGTKLINLPIKTKLEILSYKEINTRFGLSYLILARLEGLYQTFYADAYNKKILENNKKNLYNKGKYYFSPDVGGLIYEIIITGTYTNKHNNKTNKYKVRRKSKYVNLEALKVVNLEDETADEQTQKIILDPPELDNVILKYTVEMENLNKDTKYIITKIKPILHRKKQRYIFKLVTPEGQEIKEIFKSSYFLEKELNNLTLKDCNQILFKTTKCRTNPSNKKNLQVIIIKS